MPIDRFTPGREPTLRPTRWPTLPRRGTVVRVVLVTALLGLAAGILYTRDPTPPCSAPTAERPGPSPPVPGTDRPPLPPGLVGVPVRLTEPATLAVVRPGTRVDLIAVTAAGTATPGAQESTLVAARALVLDVVGAGGAEVAPVLYLALQPDQAHKAVAVPESTRFAIIVR